jgi:hypothetical protein
MLLRARALKQITTLASKCNTSWPGQSVIALYERVLLECCKSGDENTHTHTHTHTHTQTHTDTHTCIQC